MPSEQSPTGALTAADQAARQVLLTCEHASRAVPPLARGMLRKYLSNADREAWADALQSHRGWDPGAVEVMRLLQKELGCTAIPGKSTRLLVDLNRSPHNFRRFSSFTRTWPKAVRDALDAELFVPHFERVRAELARAERTLHIAMHSFDPSLKRGRERIDVGVLYDPSRAPERHMADAFCRAFVLEAPSLHVRRNAPYQGVADGLPTALRKMRRPKNYVGFEIEISQARVHDACWRKVRQGISRALVSALSEQAWV